MQRTLPACDNPNCIHSKTCLAIKKDSVNRESQVGLEEKAQELPGFK